LPSLKKPSTTKNPRSVLGLTGFTLKLSDYGESRTNDGA